jgi:heme/copper-type cytochrome/quinol oxidase subunit 3
MAQQVNTNETDLSRDELIALRNKRTGMTVFQISWIMVFVCLFVVNLSIRGNFLTWPPEGVERLSPVVPVVVSILLLVSGWTAYRSLKAINAGDTAHFFSQWRLTMGLGVLFLIGMGIHWFGVTDSGQYGTISRSMIGYHALHALAIMAYMWHVDGRVRAGVVNARDSWSVEAGFKLWVFVIVAWIIFFAALYVL